jgi:hypothetical protein
VSTFRVERSIDIGHWTGTDVENDAIVDVP